MKNLIPIKMAYVLCFSRTADTGHIFGDLEVPQNIGALGHSVPEGKQEFQKNTGMSIDVEN